MEAVRKEEPHTWGVVVGCSARTGLCLPLVFFLCAPDADYALCTTNERLGKKPERERPPVGEEALTGKNPLLRLVTFLRKLVFLNGR